MAITPNTDFTSGQILTATQQNQFPRGVMSFAETATSINLVTTEQVCLTLPSFTAVANRYYRVTGYFPYCEIISGAAANIQARIRKGTTTAGTQLQISYSYLAASLSDDKFMFVQWTGTLTAGAQQMVLTFQSASSALLVAGATTPIQFLIEDIGGA